MRLIVVGAGGITRDLLRGLGEIWQVSVVDIDSQRLALAKRVRPIDVTIGDGSSRVVLEKAGLDHADALVAATNSDEVNQEACRIAKEAGVFRVVAVAADPEQLGRYRALKLAAYSPDRLTARRIEINLEPRRIASAAFADGMAEAAEFRVEPDSPLVGRSLEDIHLERSLIAAVLRDGGLIIPHGETVLQAGDLVTVVGAVRDHATIVRAFTQGEASFPAGYGRCIAVVVDEAWDLEELLPEAVYLTRNSAAEGILILHRNLESMRDAAHMKELGGLLERIPDFTDQVEVRTRVIERGETIRSVVCGENVGVVVMRALSGRRWIRRLRLPRLRKMMRGIGKPILLAAGTQPYRHIVIAPGSTKADQAAGRAAIDLASYGNTRLIGVGAVPPTFMAGEDAVAEATREVNRLREEAAIKNVVLKRRIQRGNPVHIVTDVVNDEGLLVLPLPPRLPGVGAPGAVGHLLIRSKTSVLLVPEED